MVDVPKKSGPAYVRLMLLAAGIVTLPIAAFGFVLFLAALMFASGTFPPALDIMVIPALPFVASIVAYKQGKYSLSFDISLCTLGVFAVILISIYTGYLPRL